jgi:hypothetical protein
MGVDLLIGQLVNWLLVAGYLLLGAGCWVLVDGG